MARLEPADYSYAMSHADIAFSGNSADGSVEPRRLQAMKRTLLSIVALLAAAALTPAKAQVTQLDDPLHGDCLAGCVDNGTNTPIVTNGGPVTGFGFTISPGSAATGDLLMAFLIANTAAQPGTITVTGSPGPSGTATLFSAVAWTAGQLDSYLGISASPTNPIGAYLPSTLPFNPGATGFKVFTVDLGMVTLNAQASGLAGGPIFNASAIPLGSYIVGFLNEGTAGIVATANSGALITTGVPEPSTWAMMLLGFVGLGFAFRQSRRKVSFA
jgi:hypothetical protein